MHDPLRPVLERLGYRLNPIANDNYVVIGLAQDIVVKDHYWVCADTGAAGNAIDFVVRLKGMPFTSCACSRRKPGGHLRPQWPRIEGRRERKLVNGVVRRLDRYDGNGQNGETI